MSAVLDLRSAEIDRNFDAFAAQLEELACAHGGKFAVMHDAKIVAFCDTLSDAVQLGAAQFPDGMFSVQEVTQNVANFGYFSYALHHAAV